MPYRNFTFEELVYQYSPREAVPDHPVWKAQWRLASGLARRRFPCRLRVPYGPSAGQTLDVFPAHGPGAPINVFVHGGFWRFLDSFDHSLVAPAIVDAGGAAVLLNYDLCPNIALPEVIAQVRSALRWVWDNAEEMNGDRERIFVSGHSAGGHLASMMCIDGCLDQFGLSRETIKGATIVSAMLDLEPVLMVPGAEDLGVASHSFQELSPKYVPPAPHIPLVLAVGGRETSEWIRQTEDMLEILHTQGSCTTFLKPDYDQHYSILLSMGNPLTELCASMISQMGLATESPMLSEAVA